MTPEQEALREKVAREFTGHIASTCCHRTGGINDDPKCECRVLADAAIAVVLKEALDGIGKVKDGWLNGATVKSMKTGFVEAVFRDFDEAILSLIPQEEGK